ncbi:Na+/H+ antiporter subunit G [Edaphobacillus lindanitolerans]|uniref:Multisubunit sodium/proton antiporter, MrpG subunit n=1 Tax=Edaphobacillus lindanitolerans TaxID=550447 RepID=A0A1U7PSJ5_9BACI|nr:Na+/H+ antiporter subunit G [Edaphobacillus lindanitolerans]SIT89339.1 multisubunit sodium/proton antiporter, MrpG subunit [Edaphobacillus lindanitolerans]
MNADTIVEYTAAILMVTGGLMSLVSAIGLIRLPDVYTRSHAATKSSTLAVLLTLLGGFLYFWALERFISVRLLLGILFVFLTAPVAGHVIIRAAHRSGVKLADISKKDELAEAKERLMEEQNLERLNREKKNDSGV